MNLEGRLKRSGVTIVGGIPEQLTVLDPDGHGLRFIADLQSELGERQEQLLAEREQRYKEFDNGKLPDFLAETRHIREDTAWRVAAIPDDLKYRWAELTGPANVDTMVYGALTSGADTWMADYEDALSPTWPNILANTFNLRNAVSRQLKTSRGQELNGDMKLATLITRPRGLHLKEGHMLLDGKPVSATIFDLGMIHYHLTASRECCGVLTRR